LLSAAPPAAAAKKSERMQFGAAHDFKDSNFLERSDAWRHVRVSGRPNGALRGARRPSARNKELDRGDRDRHPEIHRAKKLRTEGKRPDETQKRKGSPCLRKGCPIGEEGSEKEDLNSDQPATKHRGA
jgi:hypothetical protein